MSTLVRKFRLSWLDIQNAINMIRGSQVIAGSLARQGLLKRLRNFKVDEAEKSQKPTDIFREVSLNAEELGGLKLTFIELWTRGDSNGDLRDAIETLATRLDIWTSHVLKNLPKEPLVAIDSFDSDPDILLGDSGQGKVEVETAPVASGDAASSGPASSDASLGAAD